MYVFLTVPCKIHIIIQSWARTKSPDLTGDLPIFDISVFCPGFQKGRVPSEKGTLAR